MPDGQSVSLWDRMQVWAMGRAGAGTALPSAQTDLPPAAQPVRSDEGYLRLVLGELRLGGGDGLCALIAAVRLGTGTAQSALFQVARISDDGIALRGRILIDWLAYRGGDAQAAVAVLAFPASASAALAALEASPEGAMLAQALAHSAQVEVGVRALLANGDPQVRIAWIQGLVASARVNPAYFAAWGDGAPAGAGALSVREGHLLAHGLGAPGNFLLGRVETAASRDDVRLPDADAHFQEALRALLQHERQRALEPASQALAAILSSPDLARADRQRIAAAVSTVLADATGAALGATGEALPTLATVIARARPASAMRNMPDKSVADLMAPLVPKRSRALPPEGERSAPPTLPATPPETGGIPAAGEELSTERFTAHPLLEAPESVAPDQEFEVKVGFRPTLDPKLAAQAQIVVEKPLPGVPMRVSITSFGVEVLDDDKADIPLEMDAFHTFRCKPKPGVDTARILATYYYRWQCVGFAVREVPVAAPGAARASAPRANVPQCVMQMPLPPELAVDLEVHLSHHETTETSRLHWELMAPGLSFHWKGEGPSLPNAASFATRLITLMDSGATGQFAVNALRTMGQDIRAKIPEEFFRLLDAVQKALGADPARAGDRPALLWYTDTETFIPWELALLPDSTPGNPRFLGQVVRFGRWLRSEGVQQPPPAQLEVQHITAVASAYGTATPSGLRTLDFALPERKTLHDKYGAAEAEATQAGIEPLVATDVLAGHLIHFAVHGTSLPKADSHYISLEDNTQLHPEMLVGTPSACGETPRFAFVFINACQVGTSGEALGLAAGFPGRIVRSGACGFVAPLWSVNDEQANKLATQFYALTLGPFSGAAQGMAVGEVLRAQRDPFDPKRGTTPMAYIYYGHPNLRLRLKP